MAVELVGSALVSAFLQVTFDRLASAEILDYFQGRKLNEKLLNKLKIMLGSINVVVDDAERKQIRNQDVKAWLDAEDLLDEIDTQISKCKLEAESQSITSKVRNFFSAAVSSFDKGIESRMQEVLNNLEYLASKKDILGLKEASTFGVGLGSQMSQKLASTSLLGETVIYGRDVDKERVFNWLMSNNENDKYQLTIISMVGMGGMGKTTLAQHLYNDPRMEGNFDIKAWVCVSHEFDVFKITRAVLEAITGSTDDSRDLNMVHGRLKEKLNGKKFFLVLDDVWNKNHMQWEALQTPFSYGAQGSKILVTTRSMEVASIMRSIKIHQLKQLQGDHWIRSGTWIHELFAKFKFLRVLSLPFPDVKEVPSLIGNLKHLRYLDLAYTAIKKLPESTCLLYNLQVLKLNHCLSLEELPLNLHKLTNLCHLDFSGTKVRKMPMHLGKLENLQVLTSFYMSKSSKFNIQQLGELNLRGTLSIWELQNITNPLDALEANMKNKKHIVKLQLGWSAKHDDSEKEREVLQKLQPSKHLEELSIREYGGTRFPDWFGDNSLSNVVSLTLWKCGNCVVLPPLGLLPSLKNLSIEGLSEIMAIGSEFYGNGSSSSSIPFPSLETLSFSGMEGWEEWECKIVRGAFPRLQKISIGNCPKLKGHLPEQLPCLMTVTIYDCKQLVASIARAPSIHHLYLKNCGKLQLDYHPSSLKTLRIGGHCLEGSLLERIGHILSDSSLEELSIVNCPNMNIPIRHCYNFLVTLHISNSCDSLRTFPLDIFPKLQILCLEGCSNLEMISQEHDDILTSLTHLKIRNCPEFVSFPRRGLSEPKLDTFEIKGLENLKTLPESMHNLLPLLRKLDLEDCPQVESFSNGGLPSNLKYLVLWNCSKILIASLKCALATNTCLCRLSIKEVDVESFPDEGLLPLSLTSLSISWCPDLNKLDYKGLCHLSSLKLLSLVDCPKLQCLPEEGLPKSISALSIRGDCSLLKQRCQKPNGEDWGKISHIQKINCCKKLCSLSEVLPSSLKVPNDDSQALESRRCRLAQGLTEYHENLGNSVNQRHPEAVAVN
ncbi:P-loop containing nucleoside triphosphate hydrolase [Sesbania bispinosa]|nr:P-loop containing nucleoside triphosphate hydrolase [Sesbania bispinosa]